MPTSQPDDDRPDRPELFISYASSDVARAQALHARLVAAGRTVWFDKARLSRGCDWHQEIEAGCEAARLVLPLITPRWNQSEWTKFETYGAPAVLPLVAEGAPSVVLPPPLRHLHAPAFDPLTATDADWRALIRDIDAGLARPPAAPAPAFQQFPHEPNRWFTGREAEMNRLHEALHPGPSPQPDVIACAVTGLGGLGKTTLVSEYARRFHRLYPQILWIWGDRDYALQFAALHEQVVGAPAPAGMTAADQAARVMAALCRDNMRLLVLDNVTDPQAADAWIPRGGGCRTLITSRDTQFPPLVRGIALAQLSADAARGFLCARTGRAAEGAERAACDRLVARLEGLPLALEQAAAFMVAQRMGFAKYLARYDEEAADLLARPVPGFTHYPHAVIATWRITLEKLPPAARAVLRLCSALGSASVALSMLLDGAQQVTILADTLPELRPRRSWLPWGGRRDGVPTAPRAPERKEAQRMVRDAVAEGLHRYSMIQDWDGDSETFRVHAVVRDVEWLAMGDKGTQRYACKLLSEVLAPYVPSAPRDTAERDACDAALAHGAAFWRRLKQAGLDWPDEKLPGELYECAAARGAVAAAEDYAYEHYEAARRCRGPISDVTLRAAVRVAHSLYRRGEYATALPILQVILHGYEVKEGPEHPGTLASINNLAECMRALGDAAGAVLLHRRALDSRERVVGPEHPDTLTSVNNLAACMRALGDAAGALPLFRRALEGREHVLGPEHPDTLISANNLAVCMEALGDAAGALPLYRRALEAHERVLGPEHPNTLTSVNNLADTMRALGDMAGALPLHRRAVESSERVLGPEHPNTLASVNNLARCMRALGDAAGALPLYRRAFESCERVLGPEHPNTLASVNNLALCMLSLGDAAGALPLYRRLLESSERVLGPEHPDTLRSVNNLAECMEALGDAAGAAPLHRRALEARERVLGPEHPDTLGSVNNLAGCMEALGDAGGALPLFRGALECSERVFGPEHPGTLTGVNNLAACMKVVGDVGGALPLFRRALETREQVLGPEHPDTLISVNNLGECLKALGDAPGALALYRRALDGCERVLGKDHPQTRTVAANLAALLGEERGDGTVEPPKPEQPAWSLGPMPISVSYATAPASLGYSVDVASGPDTAGPATGGAPPSLDKADNV